MARRNREHKATERIKKQFEIGIHLRQSGAAAEIREVKILEDLRSRMEANFTDKEK